MQSGDSTWTGESAWDGSVPRALWQCFDRIKVRVVQQLEGGPNWRRLGLIEGPLWGTSSGLGQTSVWRARLQPIKMDNLPFTPQRHMLNAINNIGHIGHHLVWSSPRSVQIFGLATGRTAGLCSHTRPPFLNGVPQTFLS